MSDSRKELIPTALLFSLGVALLGLAVQHHLGEIMTFEENIAIAFAIFLDGVPAIGVAVAGYYLLDTEFSMSDRWRVCLWTFTGLILFMAVIGATLMIRLAEGRPIAEPLFPLLVAAEMGALGGFISGYNNVRMSEQAREAQVTKDRLEEANRRLEASNERLEQFAYAASHDLREPLRMVSSYLQLLENRYADELDDEAREFIDFAVDGAERMSEMIESLLEYSRVERGAPLEPTDANLVLDRVLTDLQLQIEETGATITADELPTVLADEDQLSQVLQNLISNALKYSGDEPPRIHIGVERVGESWRFSVADNGLGIDPDDQDEIFNMFEQFAHHDDLENDGTGGIGLAMCDRIVERHGGEIHVESEPGEGSIFYFTMPIPQGQPNGTQNQPQAPAA